MTFGSLWWHRVTCDDLDWPAEDSGHDAGDWGERCQHVAGRGAAVPPARVWPGEGLPEAGRRRSVPPQVRPVHRHSPDGEARREAASIPDRERNRDSSRTKQSPTSATEDQSVTHTSATEDQTAAHACQISVCLLVVVLVLGTSNRSVISICDRVCVFLWVNVFLSQL